MGLPATSWRHMWRIRNAEDICLISPGSVYNYRLAGRTLIVSRIIEIINLKRNKTESNIHWEILSISSWSPYAFQFNSVIYVTILLKFWRYIGNRVQWILSMNKYDISNGLQLNNFNIYSLRIPKLWKTTSGEWVSTSYCFRRTLVLRVKIIHPLG